jgi:hypothetical protein
MNRFRSSHVAGSVLPIATSTVMVSTMLSLAPQLSTQAEKRITGVNDVLLGNAEELSAPFHRVISTRMILIERDI